jgi:hypothetical protein
MSFEELQNSKPEKLHANRLWHKKNMASKEIQMQSGSKTSKIERV